MNSTYTSIKNQIQSLVDAANNKTGLEDADLTSAVGSLISGYSSEQSNGSNRVVVIESCIKVSSGSSAYERTEV